MMSIFYCCSLKNHSLTIIWRTRKNYFTNEYNKCLFFWPAPMYYRLPRVANRWQKIRVHFWIWLFDFRWYHMVMVPRTSQEYKSTSYWFVWMIISIFICCICYANKLKTKQYPKKPKMRRIIYFLKMYNRFFLNNLLQFEVYLTFTLYFCCW